MPLDYLSQIEPLEDQGMSDADIVSLLAASTNKDIAISELENFLDFENLAKRDALTGSWVGVLPDEVTNNAFGLADGLSALFNHINKPRSVVVDTTVSPWASDAAALTNGLLAAGLITAQQQTDFYALGGGQPNADLTEADVAQSRADHLADQARTDRQLVADEKYNEFLSPVLIDIDATDADIAAALVAWSNSYTE